MPKSFHTDTPDPIEITVSVSLKIAGLTDELAESLTEALKEAL